MKEPLTHKKIEDFLHWFDSLWNSDKPVSFNEVEKFFALDVHFFLNSQLIASDLHGYLARLNALKAKCKRLKIHFPAKEILIEGNKAAVTWEETLTFHDGTIHHIVDAAFFHFNHDGKISKFSDVFNGADPVT